MRDKIANFFKVRVEKFSEFSCIKIVRERGRERQRDRQTERERQTDRQTETVIRNYAFVFFIIVLFTLMFFFFFCSILLQRAIIVNYLEQLSQVGPNLATLSV